MFKKLFSGYQESNNLGGRSFRKNDSSRLGQNTLPSAPNTFFSFMIDFMVLLMPRILFLCISSFFVDPFRRKFIDDYTLYFGPIDNINLADEGQRNFFLSSSFTKAFLLMIFAIWIIGFIYNIAMLNSKYQATVGKRMMSIYLIKVDNSKLTLLDIISRVLLSYIPYILPVVLILLWKTHFILGIGIGILMFSWNRFTLVGQKNRPLHDVICGTSLVRGKKA